ncbi:MAG: stage III sporulation protein AA [Cellulosilyticum sp.]|nr:stage III sporulation protein AA [Cellulosilyticum sp.]
MEALLKVLPNRIKTGLACLTSEKKKSLQEIRLRVEQPLILKIQGEESGLDERGTCPLNQSIKMTKQELTDILHYMSDFSLYALEDELRQGFMTLEGGHRVGLVGKVVLENNHIKTLRSISGMNIRIAHEVLGCSIKVMPYVVGRDKVYHTLIVSPPGCGKTTLLRDMIYQLSEGFKGYGPYTVGVVDERSEIAACYQGVPQNHLGMRTDVLDGCPKVEGMRMLLRAMSPQVVAVDEIGNSADCQAIEEMLSAGVSIICTVHGKDERECLKKPYLGVLLEEGLFERVVILSYRQGPCTVESILDGTKGMKRII